MRALLVPTLLVLAVLAGCAAPEDPAVDPPEEGSALAGVAWTRHPDAPTPRTEVAVAALDGRVYVLGGFVASGEATGLVEVYDVDVATETWSRAPDYPLPVHHAGLVAHDGALYVVGGYTTRAFVPTNLAFKHRPGSMTWEPIAPLPMPRGAHAAAVLDDMVWVVGGVGVDRSLRTEVHVYDPATDRWAEGPAFPTPRDHLGAAVVDGRLYAVGGRELSLQSNLGALDVYDPATGAWAAREPMPTPRGGIAVAAWRGHVVVLGGEEPDGTFAEVEAYDPAADAWVRLPDLPSPRHGFGAAVAGERLYAMLGGPEPGFTMGAAAESLG